MCHDQCYSYVGVIGLLNRGDVLPGTSPHLSSAIMFESTRNWDIL